MSGQPASESTMVDLDELEALANPDQTPLSPHPCSVSCLRVGAAFTVAPGEQCPECSWRGIHEFDGTAFRAAFNPTVALALIEKSRGRASRDAELERVPVTDEQLAADLALLREYYPQGNAVSGDLPWELAIARITAALAARGGR